MSTRCNIVICEKGKYVAILYHHHDGFPEGVGVDLVKFLNQFKHSYCSARDVINGLIKDNEDEYEWTYRIHSDIEYAYVIECSDRSVKCYERESFSEEADDNFEQTFIQVSIPA